MAEESTTPDLVELTRRALEALSSYDLDVALGPCAPDAVYEAVSLGTTFEGVEAIRGFVEDWLGAYEQYELEPEEILDLGNGVLFVVVRLTGRPAGSANALIRRRPLIFRWAQGWVRHVTAPSSDVDEARSAAERLAAERA